MDFIPGDPANADVNDLPALVETITSIITDSESVADEADAEIVVPILEDIKEAEAAITSAENDVLGEIGVTIDDAESVIAKVRDKAIKDCESLLMDAYTYLDLLGIPLPTPDELAYYEATNSYSPNIVQPVPPNPPAVAPIPPNPNDPIILLPGQSCPPGYMPYPRPEGGTECRRITVTEVGGGSVTLPPVSPQQCPPGYHFQPSGTSESNTEFTPVDFQRGQLSEQARQCYPPVNLQYPADYPEVGPIQTGVDTFIIQPWTNAESAPPGLPTDQFCFSGCHLRPPVEGQVCFYVPVGWRILVNPTNGHTVGTPNIVPGAVDVAFMGDNPAPETGNPPSPDGGTCVPDDTLGGSCKPADELCGEPSEWPSFPSDGKDKDPCDLIQETLERQEGMAVDFSKFIIMQSGVGKSSMIADAIINAITGGQEPILVNLVRRFAQWMQKTVEGAANDTACDSPAMVAASTRLSLMRVIDHWLDIIPDAAVKSTEQVVNTACQYNLPSGVQADQAYLADTIDEKTWECWHKAEGNHLEPARKVLFGKRTTPTPSQLDMLWRRDKIDFESMRKGMRENGVIRDEDRFRIHDLNEHWPTPTDLISWMKRDVFDDKEVDWSEADQDFEKKYTAEAEKLGDGMGLPRKTAKNHWRAHYHYPSYSMGREFLARFNNPNLPDNVRFTEEDFRNLLKVDDWHPQYIDRMIKNSYHPVTRSDAVKAYMIHAISDEELVTKIKHTGYTQEDAEFYKEYYKKRRLINDRKASGFPTMRTAVNAYSRCEMAANEFRDIVEKIAIDDDQKNAAFDAANTSRRVWERKQAIRTIKRPYILGLYDDAQVQTELANARVDPDCVHELMQQWQRERMRRDKYLTASQLCQMYERGILSERAMVLALVRSGWSEADAVLITVNCGAMVSEKLQKKAQQEANRQASELRRLQREAEKARRLAECGPPPCPSNRQQSNHPSAVGP